MGQQTDIVILVEASVTGTVRPAGKHAIRGVTIFMIPKKDTSTMTIRYTHAIIRSTIGFRARRIGWAAGRATTDLPWASSSVIP